MSQQPMPVELDRREGLPPLPPKKTMKMNQTPMRRLGFGSAGRPIALCANHFKASLSKPMVEDFFYQYTVSLSYDDGAPLVGRSRDILSRRLVERVEDTYADELGGKALAYDGASALFTAGPLPHNRLHFTVALPAAAKNGGSSRPGGGDLTLEGDCKRQRCSYGSKLFIVEISFAAKIQISALKSDEPDNTKEAVRVLDIILQQEAAKKKCLIVRQSFFTSDAKNCIELGGGLLGWRGIYSSFQHTQSGLSLNMDLSSTVIFKPGSVLDFLMANQNVRSPNEIQWRKVQRILKNMRVTIRNRDMERKITGLSEHPCNRQIFQLRTKNVAGEVCTMEVTVYDYFVQHLHIELQNSGDLPCINVGKTNPIYYPFELCSLVPLQRYHKALSFYQSSALMEGSRQKPQKTITVLSHALQSNKFETNPILHACGISINHNLMKVKGRVLSAPKLKVGNGKEVLPYNGKWSFQYEKLYEPVKIGTWAVVNFSDRQNICSVCQDLIKCGIAKGINIGQPLRLFEENSRWKNYPPAVRVQQMFRQLKLVFPDKPPEFVLCILSNGRTENLYGPWKKKCLSDYGIVTQCVASTKMNNQYLSNLLLKINVKIGGLNSLLIVKQPSMSLITRIPTLILGMDVCHGPSGQSNMPSIAAVVGSRKWPSISHYKASMRPQLPKVEIIDSLFQLQSNHEDKGVIWEHLQEFYKSSGGKKPEQIIIFRDGVGKSQFGQILNNELEQAIKACKLHYDRNLPKFTLIVAQKRHHTKFFLDGSSDNVPSGTVVDTGVCDPKKNDFFMCPHLAISGTARPKHYYVLRDDIGFSTNYLQELVHSLSYVYQRSDRVVSEVAPIRYAHLAAAQMFQFIKSDDGYDSVSSPIISSMPELPKLHTNVRNSMFFC